MIFADSWVIIPGEGNSSDAAYTIAVADLQDACDQVGIELNQGNTTSAASGNCILVGNAVRNATVAAMISTSNIEFQNIQNSQGFEMATVHQPGGTKALIIAGGGIEGDIYGLYWLWDRIRVFKTIPELNLVRIPALT